MNPLSEKKRSQSSLDDICVAPSSQERKRPFLESTQSSLSAVLRLLYSNPLLGELDGLLFDLLASLVAVTEDDEQPRESLVKRVSFDFTTTRHTSKLEGLLKVALGSAAALRSAISQHTSLEKQCALVIAALGESSTSTSLMHHERRVSAFLCKELETLCRGWTPSHIETRYAEVLSSLFRAELKLLLNATVTLKQNTGSFSHNYEDTGAVFYTALGLVSHPWQRSMEEEIAETSSRDGLASLLRPMINALSSTKGCCFFMKPVKELWPDCHDYTLHVATPMDLGTVSKRLEAGEYRAVTEVAADIRLIFSNAVLYNGARSAVGEVVRRLEVSAALFFARAPLSNTVRTCTARLRGGACSARVRPDRRRAPRGAHRRRPLESLRPQVLRVVAFPGRRRGECRGWSLAEDRGTFHRCSVINGERCGPLRCTTARSVNVASLIHWRPLSRTTGRC